MAPGSGTTMGLSDRKRFRLLLAPPASYVFPCTHINLCFFLAVRVFPFIYVIQIYFVNECFSEKKMLPPSNICFWYSNVIEFMKTSFFVYWFLFLFILFLLRLFLPSTEFFDASFAFLVTSVENIYLRNFLLIHKNIFGCVLFTVTFRTFCCLFLFLISFFHL